MKTVKNHQPKNGNNITKIFRCLPFIISSHQHVGALQIHARWKWLSSSCGLVVLRSEIWGSQEPPTDNYHDTDNSSQTSMHATTHTLIRSLLCVSQTGPCRWEGEDNLERLCVKTSHALVHLLTCIDQGCRYTP